METIIRWVLLTVAVGLTAQTARPHFRYGDWLDASSTFEALDVSIPFGMGAIMVLLHIGKVMMPAAGAMFWYRSQHIRCALAILLFPLLVTVSVTSTLAFLDLQRGKRAASEATTLKREVDLRADLAATETRLKNIGWRRAAAVVEGEIAAERRNPLWSGTDGCSDATTRQQQRYCGALDHLTGELAAAREAEDDRRREKEIRAELRNVHAANSSLHPDLNFLSRALEVSLKRAGFWRTVLFAAAIEATEALFFLFGTAPANNDRQGRKQPRWIGMCLLSGYRRTVAWAKARFRRRAATSSPPTRHAEAAEWPEPRQTRAAPVRVPRRYEKVPRARSQAARVELRPRPGTMGMASEAAVGAFVAECARVAEARIPGRAMFSAYDRLRQIRGWPRLSPAIFGRHLKSAVQRAGGTKVKASSQIYVGLERPTG
jgi:hypothetical protein